MSGQGSLIGKVVGNYEILAELGRGGMGVVYKAHEMSLQRVVALKVLPAHLAGDPEFVKRFEREARSVAQLNHPNIVTIYAVGEHDGNHFIAMEYIKGRTFTAALEQDGPFEVRRAVELLAQSADALAEAHNKDIIHRDIKPHNIMIDQAGRVKVMDFGLAKALSGATSLTAAGTAMGTPTYMSPEQCQGGALDPRTDLYSLGVTFFEMLAGRPPFVGDTPLAVISQIMTADFPSVTYFNPEVPPEVARIVEKMVARDPAARYAFAEALAADASKWCRSRQTPESGIDGAGVVASGNDLPTMPLDSGAPALTVATGSSYGETVASGAAPPDTARTVASDTPPPAPEGAGHTIATPAGTQLRRRRSPAILAFIAAVALVLVAVGIGTAAKRARDTETDVASSTEDTADDTGQGELADPAKPMEEDGAAPASQKDAAAALLARADTASASGLSESTAVTEMPPSPASQTQDSPQQPVVASLPPGQSAMDMLTKDVAAEPSETAKEPGDQPAATASPAPTTAKAPAQDAVPAKPATAQAEEAQVAVAEPTPAPAPKPAKSAEPAKEKLITGVRKEYAGGRFVDQGDGTVFDNETLLIWQKGDSPKTYGAPRPGRSSSYKGYAEGLSLGGRSSWRVPTKAELMNLQLDEFEGQELPFVNSGDGAYWCAGPLRVGAVPVFNWKKASFHFSLPEDNEKFHVRCVAGP
jgi:eukaryotic-like serine/threonine-protein kinase